MRVLKNMRRHFRNIKKNDVHLGSRYIFLCKIGDDLLKLLKKKTFWNTPHHGMPSRIIKKWRQKKQLCNHFGVSSKNHIPIEIRSKNKEKNNVFLMQNFMTFTKVSAPGTFLGAAQKVQNGDPKWAILDHGGLKKTSVPSWFAFCGGCEKTNYRRYDGFVVRSPVDKVG